MKHRIPRRVTVGKGYYIDVILVSPRILKEELEEDEHTADGAWLNELGPRKNGRALAGRILISTRLTTAQRWATFWHEMIHALNDIAAWDAEQVVA